MPDAREYEEQLRLVTAERDKALADVAALTKRLETKTATERKQKAVVPARNKWRR